MSCSCNVFDTVISVLGVVISIATLLLGLFAYKKFLTQQLAHKQLDAICELVKEIQNTVNVFSFNKNGSLGGFKAASLFDVPEMSEFGGEFDRVYFLFKEKSDSPDTITWDFYPKFYSNPLLPKSIAQKLSPFNLFHWSTKAYGEIKNGDNFIIIGGAGIGVETRCVYIKGSSIETCKGFKTAVIELRESIEGWLKNYGVDDLNITTSHLYKGGSRTQ